MPIHFFYQDVQVSLANRTILKQYISKLLKDHGKVAGNIQYIFCTDEALLEINRAFLKHDYYTDIITFDLSQKPPIVDAEIYISIDRVKENAYSEGESFKKELHRVIFHGILHLCGFKDKSVTDSKKMRAAEDIALKNYFK